MEMNLQQNGATGSRLISGNHPLYGQVEDFLADFHNTESALIFNSGYDANVGFFSSVPQRGDVILFDELAHASIRDGITMSHAKSHKFKHNDMEDLRCHLERSREVSDTIYIVTESVFSMDGDSPNFKQMAQLADSNNAHLVIDEAHATGVYGNQGVGLVQGEELNIFARIITFGKALGCHGAVILGSEKLKEYLVNFARSFIYTTGLPPHSLATILWSYQEMRQAKRQEILIKNIKFFKKEMQRLNLQNRFIESNSAIHSCLISGTPVVKSIAKSLQQEGFYVKPIVSPTVPEKQERIRFCLHNYNSFSEITEVLTWLRTFVTKEINSSNRDLQ
jgi:8-amino-7-oxononanoate synthase